MRLMWQETLKSRTYFMYVDAKDSSEEIQHRTKREIYLLVRFFNLIWNKQKYIPICSIKDLENSSVKSRYVGHKYWWCKLRVNLINLIIFFNHLFTNFLFRETLYDSFDGFFVNDSIKWVLAIIHLLQVNHSTVIVMCYVAASLIYPFHNTFHREDS